MTQRNYCKKLGRAVLSHLAGLHCLVIRRFAVPMPPSPERGLRESVLQMLTVLHLVFATKRLCSRGSFVVPSFLRFDRLFLLWLKADADAAGGVNALHETVHSFF